MLCVVYMYVLYYNYYICAALVQLDCYQHRHE